jgi:hypothetical protein
MPPEPAGCDHGWPGCREDVVYKSVDNLPFDGLARDEVSTAFESRPRLGLEATWSKSTFFGRLPVIWRYMAALNGQ